MSRVWIVAAGTGGHIFPGIALVEELKKIDSAIDPLFFGTRGRLEEKLLPKAGFEVFFLNAVRWKGRGVVGKILGLVSLGIGFIQALYCGVVRRPKFMVSVGGYTAVPVGLACVALNIPYFLIEPNISSGISNRLLSRWAKKAWVAMGSDASQTFKCPIEEGVPVRSGLGILKIRNEVKRILVLGGSQGAKKLSEVMVKLAFRLQQKKPGLEIFIQTGTQYLESTRQLAMSPGMGSGLKIEAFIEDMTKAYEDSDLIVARAGASTVNEVMATARPTIFVPFPFAADDHQRKNAKLLEDEGAAFMVDETDKDFEQKLFEKISEVGFAEQSLKKRQAIYETLAHRRRSLSAAEIAQRIVSS